MGLLSPTLPPMKTLIKGKLFSKLQRLARETTIAAMLEPLGPDLWFADGGVVSFNGFDYPTRMAVARLAEHGLTRRCDVLFSPCHGRLSPADLADWLLADRLLVRFQLQLHKVLWGDQPGR